MLHNAIVIDSEEGGLIKTIPFNEVCQLFYPAYCMTIHKAQGQTFRNEYTIYEWNRLDERLKYVALSRGVCKKNVNIIN